MSLAVRVRHTMADFTLDVDLDIPDRGVTALFGPSGAGKSSLVSAIAGLTRPQWGRIAFGNDLLLDTTRKINVRPNKRRIGYVFQEGRLFPHLNVRANLLYGWRRTGRVATGNDIDDVISLLGLGSLLDRRPAGLSGGERQRVALGRALLANSRLLLLDEPLSGLDDARRREILPWLEHLRDHVGLPMIYVSHAIDEVARLADHVALMKAGQVTALGPVQSILSRLDLLSGNVAAESVLLTRLVRRQAGHGLSELRFSGKRLFVPELSPKQPEAVRVHIAADDVMLAVSKPDQISANNVLCAEIVDMRVLDHDVHVKLDCGGQCLLSRITRRSYERLGLAQGTKVYAIIKTVRLVP